MLNWNNKTRPWQSIPENNTFEISPDVALGKIASDVRALVPPAPGSFVTAFTALQAEHAATVKVAALELYELRKATFDDISALLALDGTEPHNPFSSESYVQALDRFNENLKITDHGS